MHHPPFTSPQTKGLAEGTKQVKTSWTLKFLKCAWSMSYISLFFLLLSTLLRFVVLIIFCYNSMCRDVWTCIDPEKMTDYAYFDSLWFNIYTNENDKSNVLRWIKAKKIFTRRYVFVPIVGW
jgi:hypothetical protein